MIWGATGGIGRALVDVLIEKEWSVVAVSRDEEALAERVACSLRADVADAFSVQRAVQAAAHEVDEVALWVYAAGDIAAAPVEEMTPAVWGRILAANLTGAYHTAHYSLPLLAADAHLVFVGAVSERLRLPGLSAYAAAKAGLEAFAEALRKEQRRRRVTVVRPSAVATPLWDKVPLRMPKDAPPPSKVAGRILAAYEEGHSGLLDLV
jgi:NAD(P)-dependent dehydrogenase (short-subunit alcohol dehydrogenase family)